MNLAADNNNPQTQRNIALTLATPGGGAAVGSLNSATLTINDDDSKMGYSLQEFSISESAATVTITVNRVGGSAGTVVVGAGTVPETNFGKATSNVDYTATTNTLTFGPGVSSQTFTVSISNDSAPRAMSRFAWCWAM